MECVWAAAAPVTVREVIAALDRDPVPAYNTVMTVLDRLERKKALSRVRDGKAYRYSAIVPRASFEADRMAAVLGEAKDRPAVLLQFVETISADDRADLAAVLAELKGARRSRPGRR